MTIFLFLRPGILSVCGFNMLTCLNRLARLKTIHTYCLWPEHTYIFVCLRPGIFSSNKRMESEIVYTA